MLGPELNVHNRAKRVAMLHNMCRMVKTSEEREALIPKMEEALEELTEAVMAYEAWDQARKN